jgi:serine/threonine protein kinase
MQPNGNHDLQERSTERLLDPSIPSRARWSITELARTRLSSAPAISTCPVAADAAPERGRSSLLQPGDVLGQRYVLEKLVAQGGMGAVWLAQHLLLRSAVAIKVMRSAEDLHGRRRLLCEARLANRVRSAHVVQVLDFGVHRGETYIAMEWLAGESLAALLRRKKQLALRDTADVITQLGHALERAHEVGVIHRDVKPENVFIVRDGDTPTIKLLDFGVALDTTRRSEDPAAFITGTPLYMSPEQARCSPSLDARSDVWALGVVAYECLLGRPPFDGETLGRVLSAIGDRPAPVPSQQGCSVQGFDAWFARACHRETSARFQSAREAALGLRRLCERRSPSNSGIRLLHALGAC